MPPRESSLRRLVVEGIDDKFSIIALMSRHGTRWDERASETVLPFVWSAGGITEVLDAVTVAAKSYERLGIVVDADLDLAARYEQLRARFGNAGLEVPSEPAVDGIIFPGTRPGSRIGIWVMPNNSVAGTLEDFLARLVPTGDPIWSHAETCTTRAREMGSRLLEKDQLRGHLHTWLAWQETPGNPFGTAITAHTLGHDSPEAQKFVSWFNQIFVL